MSQPERKTYRIRYKTPGGWPETMQVYATPEGVRDIVDEMIEFGYLDITTEELP